MQQLLTHGLLCRSPSCQVCLACMCFSPALSKGSWQNLKSNHVFLVGFWAWLTAQSMKVWACALACHFWLECCPPGSHSGTSVQIFTKKYKKGVWDIKAIVDSGGMPSSHSSLCMVGPDLPRCAAAGCSAISLPGL